LNIPASNGEKPATFFFRTVKESLFFDFEEASEIVGNSYQEGLQTKNGFSSVEPNPFLFLLAEGPGFKPGFTESEGQGGNKFK